MLHGRLSERREACVREAFATFGRVSPSPATLAISTVLKAGERVFQPFLWTETVFHALRAAQPLLYPLFGVKKLSGTLFALV